MPGTLIRERQGRVSRSLPTDTGVYFLAGPAEKGPVGRGVLCRSMAEFIKNFGGRVSYSLAWDVVDGYFAVGGSRLYFSRIVGAAPTTAQVILLDAVGGEALIVRAAGPGSAYHDYNIAVEAGDDANQFRLALTKDSDPSYIERSPSLPDEDAAVAWGENLTDVIVAPGTSGVDPVVVAAQSFAGGDDDWDTISDATAGAALNSFGRGLGPGQVGYAGRATPTAHEQLADHAKANNRRALFDHTDTVSKATRLTEAAEVRTLQNGRYGALFGPWLNLQAIDPGGKLRPVPASGLVAGVIARNDGQGISPNAPSAGDLGIITDAVHSLRATWSEDDVNEMNEAASNSIVEKADDIKIYGYRAGVSKVTSPNWWQFGHSRLYMRITALADNILERFVLKEIDGRNRLFGQLEGSLIGMLLGFWPGSLYGASPEEAFTVDTGEEVNTPETIENGEIHAVIELTMSSMGETVVLDVVKRQITG